MRSYLKLFSNKIRERAAFTLGEALVAVIILLLVTSIVAAGIPSAMRAYDNVVVASNAEVLLSTTMSALRNELSTAKDINVVGDTEITYYSQSTDRKSSIYIGKDGSDSGLPDDIMYKVRASGSDGTRLVSKEAADSRMELHVTYNKVTYENGIVVFEQLSVKRKDGKTKIGSTVDRYSIRVIPDNHSEKTEI